MTSYLFGWNPRAWPWNEMAQDRSTLIAGGSVTYKWQCSNSKAEPGDVAWIVRYGDGISPKGIVAKGVIETKSFIDHPITRPEGTAPHVEVKLEEIRSEVIELTTLEQAYPNQTWNPRQSGILLKPDAVELLKQLW